MLARRRSATARPNRRGTNALFLLVSVTIALIAVPAVAASQPRASVDQQTVIIDGARTPEQLPEYVVWTTGFTALDAFKKNFEERLSATLTLSPTEAKLVFAAAAAQSTRDEECARRQKTIWDSTKATELMARMRPVILECRWATLQAKDELLAKLSPDGASSLTAWIENRRQFIKSYLLNKSELEFYRQPR